MIPSSHYRGAPPQIRPSGGAQFHPGRGPSLQVPPPTDAEDDQRQEDDDQRDEDAQQDGQQVGFFGVPWREEKSEEGEQGRE